MFRKIKEFLFSEPKKTESQTQQQTGYTAGREAPAPKAPTPLWLVLLNTLLPTMCAVAYVLVGLFLHIWHPTWLIFFLIPIYYSLSECIERKNMNYFGYPVLAVGVYLLLGFINTEFFRTCWVILFTIPLYYLIGLAVKKKNVLWFFNCVVPALCIAGYLILGFVGKLWHPGWGIFFVIPVYYQTVAAVQKYQKEKKAIDYASSGHNDHSKVETMTQEEYEERRRNK